MLTIQTIVALIADLLACGALIARGTYAGARNGITFGIISAIAILFAIITKFQKGTRALAQYTTPASLAVTMSRLRVTECGMLHFAFARLIAIVTIVTIGTNTYTAISTLPTGAALANSSSLIAGGIVQAIAFLCTIQTVEICRTLIETAFACIARRAFAFAANMMAGSILKAFAILLAIYTICTR